MIDRICSLCHTKITKCDNCGIVFKSDDSIYGTHINENIHHYCINCESEIDKLDIKMIG